MTNTIAQAMLFTQLVTNQVDLGQIADYKYYIKQVKEETYAIIELDGDVHRLLVKSKTIPIQDEITRKQASSWILTLTNISWPVIMGTNIIVQ